MDLCCLSGKKCRYLGTYERMADQDTMVIASEALKHLDKKVCMDGSKVAQETEILTEIGLCFKTHNALP